MSTEVLIRVKSPQYATGLDVDGYNITNNYEAAPTRLRFLDLPLFSYPVSVARWIGVLKIIMQAESAWLT